MILLKLFKKYVSSIIICFAVIRNKKKCFFLCSAMKHNQFLFISTTKLNKFMSAPNNIYFIYALLLSTTLIFVFKNIKNNWIIHNTRFTFHWGLRTNRIFLIRWLVKFKWIWITLRKQFWVIWLIYCSFVFPSLCQKIN
jgi:hypothetical protein